MNVRGGWTKDVWHVNWNGAGYCVPGLANSEVVLIDTPGLNEVDGAQRAEMAHEAAQRADLVLFVTDSDLNEVEYSATRRAGGQPQADHPGAQQGRSLLAAGTGRADVACFVVRGWPASSIRTTW